MPREKKLSLPGVSSTKARILHHRDELRFEWVSGSISTRPPVSMEIHLTNSCNLRCSFCSYGQVRHQEFLPQERLDRLMADLATLAPTLKAIVFSGGGEPTLHPGFADAVHKMRDAGIEVGVITNGVRMTDEILAAFLRCAWVRVSLDTPDPVHYQLVLSPHSRTNYDKVVANLTRLSGARDADEAARTIIGIGYLVDRGCQTDAQLLSCLEVGARVGADYVHYRPIFGSPQLQITRSMDELRALAPTINATARQLGIAQQFDKFLATYGKTVAQGPKARDASCPVVSDGMIAMVAATGDVLPCYAHVMHDRDTSFGSILEQDFLDIWHGPLRKTVIRAIDASKTCPFCRFQAGNAMLWNQADQMLGTGLRPTPGYEAHSVRPDMGFERDDADPHWMFL